MKISVLGSFATGLVLAASLASAADRPFYVGASYGIASLDGAADGPDRPITGPDGELESIPVGGLPFDDEDGAWSVFGGYEAHRHVGIELGYTNFGEFGTDANFLSGTVPPVIGIESIHLAARFRYPLTSSISATWQAGLIESSFDVDGSLRIISGIGGPIFAPEIETLDVPFAEPKDETGYLWGFGFHWQFSERVSSALEFTRHDVRVFDVETYNLRFAFHP